MASNISNERPDDACLVCLEKSLQRLDVQHHYEAYPVMLPRNRFYYTNKAITKRLFFLTTVMFSIVLNKKEISTRFSAHRLKMCRSTPKPDWGDFLSFRYVNPCKTCDPWGGAKFDPRVIIWTLVVDKRPTR